MTLDEIILHCRENNQLAQRILFDRYYQQLYHLAIRYLGNQHDVEDVLSNTFGRVFNQIRSFEHRGEGSFDKWINTITINESLRAISKKKNLVFDEKLVTGHIEESQINFDSDIDIEFIYDALNQIPIAHKVVFNLFVVDGYSHKEIAERLEISENTSKSHLHRAKKQLKSHLEKLKAYEKFR